MFYAVYLLVRSVYSAGYSTWLVTEPGAVATNPAGIETFNFVLVSMVSAYVGLALVFSLFCLHLIARFAFYGNGSLEQKQLLSNCAYYLENGGNLFDDIAMLLLSTRFVFITREESCIPIFFWESLSLVFLVLIALGPSARAFLAWIYTCVRKGKRKSVSSRDYEGPYNRSLMLGPIFSFITWIALSVQAGEALKYFGLIIGSLGSLALFILFQLLLVKGERGFALNVAFCSFSATAWTLALLLVPKGVLIPVFCNDIALLITLALVQFLPGFVHLILLVLPAEKRQTVTENPAGNSGEAVLVSPESLEKGDGRIEAAPSTVTLEKVKGSTNEGESLLRTTVSQEVNMA